MVGDIGFKFLFNLKKTDGTAFDLVETSSDGQTVTFRKPSGAEITRAASYVTDGSDGQIQYVTVDGDLDENGGWKVQIAVSFASGALLYTEIGKFKVGANL